MLQDDKVKVFEEELSLIPLDYYRRWTEACIRIFPDYFFKIAASDSGSFHPLWALGEGGLVRHTKAVTKIAHDLSGTMLPPKSDNDVFTKQLSSVISACILHDSCKYGIPFDQRMGTLHPYIPRVMFSKVQSILTPVEANYIFLMVESHMGSYNSGAWSPNSNLTTSTFLKHVGALVVHQADYLASRPDYMDARFVDINKDCVRGEFVPYDPFPDPILKGLVVGILLEKGFTLEDLQTPENSDLFNSLFGRASNLRKGSARNSLYNYDHLLDYIRENADLFLKKEVPKDE